MYFFICMNSTEIPLIVFNLLGMMMQTKKRTGLLKRKPSYRIVDQTHVLSKASDRTEVDRDWGLLLTEKTQSTQVSRARSFSQRQSTTYTQPQVQSGGHGQGGNGGSYLGPPAIGTIPAKPLPGTPAAPGGTPPTLPQKPAHLVSQQKSFAPVTSAPTTPPTVRMETPPAQLRPPPKVEIEKLSKSQYAFSSSC
jgi:hypothetical protein